MPTKKPCPVYRGNPNCKGFTTGSLCRSCATAASASNRKATIDTNITKARLQNGLVPFLPLVTKGKRRKQYPERDSQIELFRFLRGFERKYPILAEIHASANGEYCGYGQEGARRRALMNAAGLLSGVWDIFAPIPRIFTDSTVSHGLYIEMKAEGGELSAQQIRFGNEMKRRGYTCVVAYSWIEAATAIIEQAQIKDAAISGVLATNYKPSLPKTSTRSRRVRKVGGTK